MTNATASKTTAARWWEPVNGSWVKITLRPGQSLTHHTGGETEEGYSYTTEQWDFDGRTVERFSFTRSMDCDGRGSSEYGQSCPVERLGTGPHLWLGWNPDHTDRIDPSRRRPDWQDDRASQRDYSAEAAGY